MTLPVYKDIMDLRIKINYANKTYSQFMQLLLLYSFLSINITKQGSSEPGLTECTIINNDCIRFENDATKISY